MTTEQNYVGRGNYANNPPQTGENGPQPSSTADSRQSELLLTQAGETKIKNARDYFQGWTRNAIRRVQCVPFLREYEREEVLRRLRKHSTNLIEYARPFLGHRVLTTETVKEVINLLYGLQSSFNNEVWYYEIKPCRLRKPYRFDVSKVSYFVASFSLSNDSMHPTVPLGVPATAYLVNPADYLTIKGVVNVTCRNSSITPRFGIMGRIAHIDEKGLYLLFDNRDKDYSYIPLCCVVFIHEVQYVTDTVITLVD